LKFLEERKRRKKYLFLLKEKERKKTKAISFKNDILL